MKVVVSGASGFIGGPLLERLRADGHEVPQWPSWTTEQEPAAAGALRGLFCGGTLADEAMLIASEQLGGIRSNIPLSPELALGADLRDDSHVVIDFGDDGMTQGRAHPMIDPTLRNEQLARAAADPATGVILLDLVLGHGAEPDPASLLAPVIADARQDRAIPVMPLVTETPAAMFALGGYAGAPRLAAITWGGEDLAAGLGARANRLPDGTWDEPYRLARSLTLFAAGAAGVPAIDTVYVDFRNEAGLRRECEEARRDGFTAKMAIHPAQVAVINAVFTPTPEAVAHAKSIVAAFEAQPGAGVIGIGGKMYDRPHLVRAKILLAKAGKAG